MSRIATIAMTLLIAAAPVQGQASLSAENLEKIKKAAVYIVVKSERKQGTGSGFVVTKSGQDLFIVTNNHVVDHDYEKVLKLGADPGPPAKIQVVFESGSEKERKASATIVALDPDRDLAVLKVSGVKDPPEPLDVAAMPKLMETMPVFACGFPFGDRLAEGAKHPEITITPCTVSSIRKDDKGAVRTIQVAGNLNPGNSGGAMVAADGSVVGVAVRSILGAGIGEVIPLQDVAAMLKGRPGRVLLTAKDPTANEAELRVAIIDPFGRFTNASAVSIKGKPGQLQLEDGLLKEGKKYDLAINGGYARGTIDTENGWATVQVVLESLDGKTVSNAVPLLARIAKEAPPEPEEPAMNRGKPMYRDLNGRPRELPAMPQRRKPKADDRATDLSDLNRKAQEFLERSLVIEGLSNCQLNQAERGTYEITLLTEAGNAPTNLRFLLPKDLALQFSELCRPDFADIMYALRLEGKLAKPEGANQYVFEAAELSFLDEDSKAVRTIKPETAAGSDTTLGTVNRFPAKFKGQKLILDAYVLGGNSFNRGLGLNVQHASSGMPVLNLRFYASPDLYTQVESDVPSKGAIAKLECVVESVDEATGQGIVGVNSIDIIDSEVPKRKLASDGRIEYPEPKAAPPVMRPEVSASVKTDSKTDTTRKKTDPAPAKSESNLGLYLGIGGVVAVVSLVAGYLLMKKRRAVNTAPKYGAKKSSVTITPPKTPPKPTEKPTPTAKPAPKPPPKAGGNPFANLE